MPPGPRILPYRAGYEAEDRRDIQRALSHRQLAGVVSTSALELGLDIGEIDLVVLLGLPPSVKAFWQRVGRAGRRNPGVCLLIDNRGALVGSSDGLKKYLARELEPSWLYMENRYIQYANALCAAYEVGEIGGASLEGTPFKSLPTSFRRFLDNEINPTEVVPSDLYPLKQRAQGGPHREFPIRSGMEPDFDVKTPQGLRLGNLTFSQALREGYPGAIYYYMARPYRVYRFDYRKGEIFARRERHWITRPLAQTMVFPRFQGGVLRLSRSEVGFLAETEMQVSERVLGFTERRGSAKPQEHRYGRNSPYYQREINRFFETTGVCWYFPERCVTSESTGARVAEAFCVEFGIQDRDLGFGFFYSRQSPLGVEKCQGACVYDATNGSLRLTQRLAEHFEDVVSSAITIAESNDCVEAERYLRVLLGYVQQLSCSRVEELPGTIPSSEGDWVVIIAPGEKALYQSQDGPITVEVGGYRYTPQGLMYELTPLDPADHNAVWRVVASALQPFHGETKMTQANLVTGETKPLP